MIKVLFLAANPSGINPLQIDEEMRDIQAKIRSSEFRDRLQLVSHWAVRLDELSGFLMRHRPDIVHFSGHGDKSGCVILVGSDGNPKPVPPEALGRLLAVLKENVRVVVFNNCYSERQAEAVTATIDCAIGMVHALKDVHAIAFAAEFYQALGYGKSIREACELGVARLVGEGLSEAPELVKLHLRQGVDPAKVTLLGGARAANPQQASRSSAHTSTPWHLARRFCRSTSRRTCGTVKMGGIVSTRSARWSRLSMIARPGTSGGPRSASGTEPPAWTTTAPTSQVARERKID